MLARGQLKKADMAPPLKHYSIFIEAFWTLNACRQNGQTINPIMFQEIASYWHNLFSTIVPLRTFTNLIQKMDAVFIRHHEKKLASKVSK